MKEHPILFSSQMVRAILDGRKTQTRRVIKPPRWAFIDDVQASKTTNNRFFVWVPDDCDTEYQIYCPYGDAGDTLWVRETHAIVPRTAYQNSTGVEQILKPNDNHDLAIFKEGWKRSPPSRWRPSIHMPRWAARMLLEVTHVRAERLQDISEADAEREGIELIEHNCFKNYLAGKPYDEIPGYEYLQDPIGSFRSLWKSINGADAWDLNPWVWVVEFERVK